MQSDSPRGRSAPLGVHRSATGSNTRTYSFQKLPRAGRYMLAAALALLCGLAASGATAVAPPMGAQAATVALTSAVINTAPSLTVNSGIISWSAQRGVTDYQGTISTTASSATSTSEDLGNVTSWSPTAQPGRTLYYRLASEGSAGAKWSTTIAITWPVNNTTPVLSVNNGIISWSAQPGVTDFEGAISTAASSGTTTTQNLGNVTTWSPTPQAGHTLYYTVASEGSAGAQWSTKLVATWPSPATAPQNTALPTVTGTATQGDTLSASAGTWSGTASAGTWSGTATSYTYQWQDCEDNLAAPDTNCHNATGSGNSCTNSGTGCSYAVTSSDVSFVLRVVVTASNGAAAGVPAASADTPLATSFGITGLLYSAGSPWNTPIGPSPTIAPNNATLICGPTGNCAKANGSGAWADQSSTQCGGISCFHASVDWVPAIWDATASTPTVSVDINAPRCKALVLTGVPIPAGALPDPSAEGHMVVLQTGTGYEWDFFKMTRPGATDDNGCKGNGDSDWQAEGWDKTTWTGSGLDACCGATGAEAAGGAGDIRQSDMQSTPPGGTWGHALAFSYDNNCNYSETWCKAGHNGGTPNQYNYVGIASTEAGNTGTNESIDVPLGARVQLSPSINCDTWDNRGLSEWQRQICRTLQVYGAFDVDSNQGGRALHDQDRVSLSGGYTYPYSSFYDTTLPNDLLPYYRFLAW